MKVERNLHILQSIGKITVKELAPSLKVSKDTPRTDLGK
ncbi:DeoR family transcriptional regulator [Oceanobacillus sp. CAU 1775]